MTRLLLVGEGIAAQAILRALEHSPRSSRLSQITQVANHELAPACSMSSTAVVALRGTRAGLSLLGDELIAAWNEARHDYVEYIGMGVTRAIQTTAIFKAGPGVTRFSHLPQIEQSPLALARAPLLMVNEEAWLIDPPVFLRALGESWKLPIEKRATLVTQLVAEGQGSRVHFLDGRDEFFDHVVLASGAWMSWMKECLPEGHPARSLRPVQGSYYQWNEQKLGVQSFSMALDGINLVYHAAQGRLLLGATSVKDVAHFLPDQKALRELWTTAQSLLLNPLPALSEAIIHTGIRSVGKDRRPINQSVRPGLHVLGGLYKNGWLLSWKLARDLVEGFI